MPTLRDDGKTVTLDLHGARIAEALRMAQRALALARQRGRRRLDLVHGASTSEGDARRPTIRSALYDWLDAGGAAGAQPRRGDAVLQLHLDLGARAIPQPITLRDVWT